MTDPKPLCIYHGNCADGFTAAWAVWKRFGDAWEYLAANYGDAPPDVAGRDVVIVDFSYKADVLWQMADTARSLLVLDHHKTARDDLMGFSIARSGWSLHLGYLGAPGCSHVGVLFDMNRSGAGIAWDYFQAAERPRIVNYAEDRDLWRFQLDFSREISAYIFSHEYSFANWDAMAGDLEEHLVRCADEGAAIERKHHKDVRELVAANRREMIIGGHWVPVANLPYTLTSDAGHLMCEPYASPVLQGEIVTPPFAACYWDTAEGRVFSLRSVEGGADVSEVAKKYGGGGHKHAAGFRLPHGVEP